MIPSVLVHYTTREKALERILCDKQIMFGLLGNTNDPKETKEWGFPMLLEHKEGFMDTRGRRNIDFEISVQNIANEVMMKEWKVLCLTKHSTYHHNRPLSKDFSRAYSHPRLWADYGGDHSGVCVIFNGNKLDQNIHSNHSKDYKIFQGSVKYNNVEAVCGGYPIDISKGSTGIREVIREYFINNYKDCFLRKVTDWRSEHEYRWLIHDVRNDPIYISIIGAIKGVIVGPNFPSKYETTLKWLCKELNIFAGKIHWYCGMPRVNKNEIFTP